MTKDQKISWLMVHAPGPYARARAQAEQTLDAQTPMFCFCGALASGFHTNHCRKFQERLKTLVINELKGLIPKE